jgi:hypothetical protein
LQKRGAATAPAVYVAVAGTLPGWRRAALLQSSDGGLSFAEVGSTAAPATMGNADASLASGMAAGFDLVNGIEVTLLHDGMALSPATDAGLYSGQNLALIGDELIQFGSAVPTGPGRYRLSRLLRGRRGTEWAIALHGTGERFIMIEADSLLPLSIPADAHQVDVQAMGIGDTSAVSAHLIAAGVALLPLSPVHLAADILGGGDISLSWTRRSRDGWRWVDGVDAPLAEESELYEVTIAPSAVAGRTASAVSASFLYPRAVQLADAASGATSALMSVRQIGAFGRSRVATLTLPLN